jgi:hypothetical protein
LGSVTEWGLCDSRDLWVASYGSHGSQPSAAPSRQTRPGSPRLLLRNCNPISVVHLAPPVEFHRHGEYSALMNLFGETLPLATAIFLMLALLMALSFEFVNGFHDTANAVATVSIPTLCRQLLPSSGLVFAIYSASLFPAEQSLSRSSHCYQWSWS